MFGSTRSKARNSLSRIVRIPTSTFDELEEIRAERMPRPATEVAETFLRFGFV
jgi:hypothetical protein